MGWDETRRWDGSQVRVEQALRDGHVTMAALVSATQLSRKTVADCLSRASVEVELTWPRRYSLTRSAFENLRDRQQGIRVERIVEPREVDVMTLGTTWQNGREKIADEIADTDMATMGRDEVLTRLEAFAASILGVIVALRTVEDSPEWRELVGL